MGTDENPDQEKRFVLRQGADRSQSQGHNRFMRTSRRVTRVNKTMRTSRKFTKGHKACVRAEDSRKACVRTADLPKSCVRTQNSCVQVEGLRILKNVSHAIIQPVVEDPAHDDSIPVGAGAEPIPIPCEPSGSETMKHELTHIPLKTVVRIMRRRQSTI